VWKTDAFMRNLHPKALSWIATRNGVGTHVDNATVQESMRQFHQLLNREEFHEQKGTAFNALQDYHPAGDDDQDDELLRRLEDAGVLNALAAKIGAQQGGGGGGASQWAAPSTPAQCAPAGEELTLYTLNASRAAQAQGAGYLTCRKCQSAGRQAEFYSSDRSPGVKQECPRCKHSFTFGLRADKKGGRQGGGRKTDYMRRKETGMMAATQAVDEESDDLPPAADDSAAESDDA